MKTIEGQIVYECDDCGASGVKLWRLYSNFLDHQKLRCASCAGKNQEKSVSCMTPDGKTPWFYMGTYMGMSDQIGKLMPAVLTAENDTFWGYTSAPKDRVEWWRLLPNK